MMLIELPGTRLDIQSEACDELPYDSGRMEDFRAVGGMKVLRASHRQGFVEHELRPEQKYAGWGLFDQRLAETGGQEWRTTDFKIGDCLVFHSHTVHGALPNLTPDRLRLSMDNRYQRHGDEHSDAAVRTHYDL